MTPTIQPGEEPQPNEPRPPFQFTLRSAIVAMTACAVVFALAALLRPVAHIALVVIILALLVGLFIWLHDAANRLTDKLMLHKSFGMNTLGFLMIFVHLAMGLVVEFAPIVLLVVAVVVYIAVGWFFR